MELSFDGTNYHGWQVQPNATSVQSTLENALGILLKQPINIIGAGRTDTGVHASYFVAHFDWDELAVEARMADKGFDSRKAVIPVGEDFIYKFNRFLPTDIIVHSLTQVAPDLHARFSAEYRVYEYYISRQKPVFNRDFCYYHYGDLFIESMNKACNILMKYTDFTSFSKLHTDVKTNNCKIVFSEWTEHSGGYTFKIKADRFLRNMVRSIVGTMLEIGKGKMDLNEFTRIIEARDRGRVAMSAEAKGLFLTDIGYGNAFKRTF